MSVPVKLGAFAAVLAVLFAGGGMAGHVLDPGRGDASAPHGGKAAPERPAAHAGGQEDKHGGASAGEGGAEAGSRPVRGVTVAADGLRLVVENPEVRRGRTQRLRFRIVRDSGKTVRDFDVEHTKRMHVIVARRDLKGFQHLHPRQRRDGSWNLPLRIDEAGSYRLFADFSHGKRATTLATDLRVDGSAALAALPAPAATARSDRGSDVRLEARRVRPGGEAELRFTVTRGGRPAHTEPYLGAGGHLVALREGDLAFLHVHPTEHGGDAHGEPAEHDDAIGFAASFPTAGRYRLFLQFKYEGRVETVAFTQEVE